ARPRGLPRDRRDLRGRDHFAFRCSPGSGPERADQAVNHVKRLAVYCGSAAGSRPEFAEATRATAAAMTARGVDLVYGGGRLGLMGLIADTVLAGGGRAYGVIPKAL